MHGIEAAIWAAAYVWLGALDSPIEAMLYSVDSMTTPLWGSIALLQIQCDVGRVHRLRKFRGLCSILMVRSPNRSGHLASYRHLLANVCIRATARRPGTTAMAHSGPRQSVLDARFFWIAWQDALMTDLGRKQSDRLGGDGTVLLSLGIRCHTFLASSQTDAPA